MGTWMLAMVRASQGVLAKQVCPGRRHSSSLLEGHHWRSAQVSVWMSAKEEPQKNLYLRLGSVARAVVDLMVVVDRRRRRVERCRSAAIVSCVLWAQDVCII